MKPEVIIRLVGYIWRNILREKLYELAEKTETEVDDMLISVVDNLLLVKD